MKATTTHYCCANVIVRKKNSYKHFTFHSKNYLVKIVPIYFEVAQDEPCSLSSSLRPENEQFALNFCASVFRMTSDGFVSFAL